MNLFTVKSFFLVLVKIWFFLKLTHKLCYSPQVTMSNALVAIELIEETIFQKTRHSVLGFKKMPSNRRNIQLYASEHKVALYCTPKMPGGWELNSSSIQSISSIFWDKLDIFEMIQLQDHRFQICCNVIHLLQCNEKVINGLLIIRWCSRMYATSFHASNCHGWNSKLTNSCQ